MTPTDSATHNAPVITIRKIINAPRERVFDAWLDPDTFRQWWCAGCDHDNLAIELDPQVGGGFRVDYPADSPCGKGFDQGIFVEITRPTRLRFTWGGCHEAPEIAAQYDQPERSDVTIDFIERSSKQTEIILTHEGLKQTARDGTQRGWETMIAAIDRVLCT